MAESYKAKTTWKVNDLSVLAGDDLLLVNPVLKADALKIRASGPSEVCVNEAGDVLYVYVAKAAGLPTDSIESFLAAAKAKFPNSTVSLPTWNYTWELVLQNPEAIRHDFTASGKTGIEGTVEQPNAIRGSSKDIFVAKGALVHPMVVLDAANGPIFIDEGRGDSPLHANRRPVLHRQEEPAPAPSAAKACRSARCAESAARSRSPSSTATPTSITTASLATRTSASGSTSAPSPPIATSRTTIRTVSVILDGKTPIDTGSTKVGALIGDHTKTSIGTLFNTGALRRRDVPDHGHRQAAGQVHPRPSPGCSTAW